MPITFKIKPINGASLEFRMTILCQMIMLCSLINGGKRKRLAFCFFFLVFFNCVTVISYSQQGNVWYFGEYAGLSFNTNPPSNLLDGQLYTFEGCASICDNNGQLLFYTNGVTVWNRLHQVMPNGAGLKGDLSATNSAIIIPKPGSTTVFYIFTAGAVETNNEGYFFSEVDMSLQGGLGDVTAGKNIPLYAPSTEKLTAVRHSNGIDVWVVTKALGNTEWRVFKVDCNGVNTTPVISFAGRPPSAFWMNVNVGCLKSSPDGTKIAAVNTADEYWELFNFDVSTGKLSNGLVFPDDPRPYGIEFSPDSKLIYVGNEWLPPNFTHGGISQYNLATYDSTAIASSKTFIGNVGDWAGALQLGPDNKIYCTAEFLPELAVINSPNSPGVACNFQDFQVDLGDRIPRRGLPVFFPSLIAHKNADFDYTIQPDCATVNFSGNTTITGGVTWEWDFGDGTTGTGQIISHTYAAGNTAIDSVSLKVTSMGACGFAVVTKKFPFDFRKPLAKFGFETQCGSLDVAFHDSSETGSALLNWNWDFGDGNVSSIQDPVHSYTPGNYTINFSVQAPNGCVSDTVSKTILVEGIPEVSFTNTQACIGEPIQFTNTSFLPFGTITGYEWDFGDGGVSSEVNPVHRYNLAGDFIVKLKLTTAGGCSNTISKSFHIFPVHAFAGNDTTVAIGLPLQLQASGGSKYQWSPPDFLSNDTVFNPIAVLTQDQRYRVQVTTEEGCVGEDEIMIRVLKGPDIYVPSAFAPNGKNKIFRPILVGIQELDYFTVYNRWGEQVFTTSEPGKGWDGRIRGANQPTGVFVWILKAKDYQGHIISRRGTVTLIQ